MSLSISSGNLEGAVRIAGFWEALAIKGAVKKLFDVPETFLISADFG